MDAVTLLRGFYLVAASSILLAYSIPPLRTRFFAYGPRASRKSDKDAYSRRKTEKSRAPRRHVTAGDPTASLLDRLASYRVPHGWFVHFYLLSVSLSAFWFYQICTQRQPFLFLARNSGVTVSNSVSVYRSGCVYAFMLGQAVRRLLECIFFAKKSSSQMWIGHWVLGLLFYAAMSISVWIEGSPAFLGQTHLPSDWKEHGNTILPTVLFLFASHSQFNAHRHLASLPSGPNYAFPTATVFNRTLTPHYLAECLIYLAMAITGAPEGQFVNRTIACALIFELINLGITANETYKWYERRFGAEKVKGKARMIPRVW